MSDEPEHFQDSVSRETYILDRRTIDQRMDDIESKQDELQHGLKANTEATGRIEKNVVDVLEAFKTFHYGFKALNTLAKVIAPLATIGTAVAALVLWLKGGGRP